MNFQIALGVFCLIVLAQGMTTTMGAPEGEKPACEKYNLPACERNYVPVCATDGHTYPTECALCYAISKGDTSALIQSRGECPNSE
ncbi:unnamed protein product [Boreogadus saida]